ncbi:MAG TPA: MFS transporter [Planctomycetaceae bacterium]|jgi:MFS family permease|nr:MFS transporter [Planctomycetaceae bacterium]
MNESNSAESEIPRRTAPRQGWREIGRSLAHRNFRLFFGGQTISLLGTWMQSTAMTWLVYRLSKEQARDSAFLLGITSFAGQIPVLLLGLVAGVLSDRWNRRRIIIVTQTLAMIQAFLLGLLTVTNLITIGELIVLCFCLGCINAFDLPTRQAFINEIVDTAGDLPNAIALNSSMVNGARLFGPSIAGIVIDLVGEAICFLLNGVSFVFVIIALLAMKIVPRPRRTSHGSVAGGLREGFVYAFGFAPVRAILLLVAMTGLVGMPYIVLLPIFAGDILQGDARTFGFLAGASGVGALSGSLYLASRSSVVGLGRWIAGSAGAFGLSLIAFSFSRHLYLSMAILCVAGFSIIVQLASCNTILQTIVDDQKRGRVMSLYTVAFLGLSPLGSLMAGSLASRIGTPNTVCLGGVCCVIGAVLFARQLPKIRQIVRPIYTQMGILPAAAAGIQVVTEEMVPPERA